MKAERDRRAMILEAEGTKQSAILRAKGEAEAIKKVADAERYKRIAVAEGEGQAIETVYGSVHKGNPTNDLIAIRYLEALGRMAEGQATKIFLPYEATGALSSIAGIGEMLQEKGPEKEKPKK